MPHISAAKKWNNVFRLSALSQQKGAHEKHFRRVAAGQFRINEEESLLCLLEASKNANN